MTQRTTTTENLRSSVPITRTGRSTSATRRDPWWISFGEAIGALFGSSAPGAGSPGNLPSEVLRDYDPALHRALTGRATVRDLDARARRLSY